MVPMVYRQRIEYVLTYCMLVGIFYVVKIVLKLMLNR